MSVFTPFPKGTMPEDVKRWADGPPYGRIELDLNDADAAEYAALRMAEGTRGILVTDQHTGERFRLSPAPCGLGCYCAADAEWEPDVEQAEQFLRDHIVVIPVTMPRKADA